MLKSWKRLRESDTKDKWIQRAEFGTLRFVCGFEKEEDVTLYSIETMCQHSMWPSQMKIMHLVHIMITERYALGREGRKECLWGEGSHSSSCGDEGMKEKEKGPSFHSNRCSLALWLIIRSDFIPSHPIIKKQFSYLLSETNIWL